METQNSSNNPSNRISVAGTIIFILVLIAIICATFYFVSKYAENKNKINDSSSNTSQPNNKVTDISGSSNSSVSPSPDNTNKSGVCKTLLTSSDNLAVKTWKTYKNTKYNYSFKYPETWTYSSDSKDDQIIFTDSESSIDFQFRAGVMTSLGFEGFKTDSKKETKIACENANITYLSADISADPSMDQNKRLIIVQFSKTDTPFLITLSYKYDGASISSDIIESLDLINKSVVFN